MKKLVGILLFLCLLAPVVSTFSYLHYHKRSVRKHLKHDMMKTLDKDSFTLLKFSKEEAKNELNWEHSREFEFEGEMYDVVQTIEIGDSIHYYCWWDHKETRLNLALNKALSSTMNQDEENKKHQNNWITWLKNILPSERLSFNEFPSERDKMNFCYAASHLDVLSIPLLPPPKNS